MHSPGGPGISIRPRAVRRPAALAPLLCLLLTAVSPAALAQQPAQRILPSVTAPRSEPRERIPCLPVFDPGLRLYLQPCKRFHSKAPADWTDRMVVAVTRAAGAVWWADLDGLEREQVARHALVVPPEAGQVGREEFRESVEAWKRYREAVEAATGTGAGTEKEEKEEGTDTATDTTAATATATEWKREYMPMARAPAVWMEGTVPLTAPWTVTFEADAGSTVKVVVENVRPALGYLWPDPVVWLVLLEEEGDPESGEVVASSDDGPQGLPAIDVAVERKGRYRVLMAAYSHRNAGLASVRVEVAGEEVVGVRSQLFGGVLLHAGSLEAGDLVFAGGAKGEGRRDDHDTVIALLPAAGSGGGRYAASNNAVGTLPLAEAACDMPDAVVLLGAFRDGSGAAGRLFVSRRGGDGDGDGLSGEVEAALGTCDSAEDARAGRCAAPMPLPPGFDTRDTDNDGLSDFEEVFGVRRCYADAGGAPHFGVPRCIAEGDRCAWRCPADAAMVAELPLSVMDGPDPVVYDVYVEYDYWQGESEPPRLHALSRRQAASVRRAFEQRYVHVPEGDEGTAGPPRFDPGKGAVRFHLYQDDPIRMPDVTRMAHVPALAHRSLAFNLFFTPDRKYTGVFHYVVGIHKGGGQTDVSGRASVIGASGGEDAAVKFVHEAGHLLGLLHNHSLPNPDHTPFYLSVMSYGYSHSLPPPIEWDGRFEPCGQRRPCPEHFRCISFPGHGDLCAPDCGIQDEGEVCGSGYTRFSSGELVLADGGSGTSEAETIPERGYPRWFLPYLYCYNSGGGGTTYLDRLRRFSDPACAGSRCVTCAEGMCDIDWDHDGSFEGARHLDLDGDGLFNGNRLGDGDDFARIVREGRKGLSVMSKKTVPAYYAGFTGMEATSVMPYPSVAHEHHGGYATDVTNWCDEADKWPHCRSQYRGEAALFRGPASGDRGIEVRLPNDFCVDLSQGLAVSVRVKPFQIPDDGAPAVLFDSPHLRIWLEGGADDPRWLAETAADGEERTRLEVGDAGALGRWTRLTVMVSNHRRSAKLTVKRGTLTLSASSSGAGVEGKACSFSIGSAEGGSTSFYGFIDDPMFLSGPAKEL